jgi:hypothetical protein
MSDDRFARQNRGGLPSQFPMTSTCTSIVHHLSGLYMIAQTPPRCEHLQTGRCCTRTGLTVKVTSQST